MGEKHVSGFFYRKKVDSTDGMRLFIEMMFHTSSCQICRVRRKRLDRLEKECPEHHYIYWQPQMPLSDNSEYIPLMADAEPYHN